MTANATPKSNVLFILIFMSLLLLAFRGGVEFTDAIAGVKA
jgi:hypothetical protein